MSEPMSYAEHCYMVLLNALRRAHAEGDKAKGDKILIAIEVFEAIWPDDVARYAARYPVSE